MEKYSGNEHFKYEGVPVNRLLLDFWAWQSSDLLRDTIRASLAEYIVATALDIDEESTQNGWDDFDLDYHGVHIEVKSAAYLQSWQIKEYSRISFRIAPTISSFWKDHDVKRRADIYIFCIFACKDRETADPMQLEQWEFYVVKTSDIDRLLGDQKTLSLWSLNQLPHTKCTYDALKESVDAIQLRA